MANFNYKGTFYELVEQVPTHLISIMLNQNRPKGYVFTVKRENGITLVF